MAQASAPNANAKDLAADLESAIHDAQAQRRSGDLAGAAKSLSQLVLIAPDNARVLGEYGKNLAAQGRSEDALAFLERAIDRAVRPNPGDIEPLTKQLHLRTMIPRRRPQRNRDDGLHGEPFPAHGL